MVAQLLFNPERAARLVQQHALDASQPSLGEVIDSVLRVGRPEPSDPYLAAIARGVQRVLIERLMGLAQTARSPEARAIAQVKLRAFLAGLPAPPAAALAGASDETAHLMLLASDIRRFLDRPWDPAALPKPFTPPPGMPIGEEP